MSLYDMAAGVLGDVAKGGTPNAMSLGHSLYRNTTQSLADQKIKQQEEEEARRLSHPTGIPLEGADGISMPQGQGSRGIMEQTVMGQPREETMIPADEPETPPKAAPVPDPTTNAAASVAAMTSNRASGRGNAAGYTDELPPMPDEAQIAAEAVVQQGKQVMFSDIETPNWYEDDSFYEGMLSFGLNLMAGNDIATAFNQGASVFQNSKALEKRQVWAKDLLAQGYDAHEIEAWVRTGDNKALSDPFEKKAREQAFALGQQQLTAAMRENDPSRIAYKDKMERWDLQNKQDDRLFNRNVTMRELGLKEQERAQDSQLKALKIKAAQDPNAGWKGRGPEGRPLQAVQVNADGTRTAVIESPEGWVDLTTGQPANVKPGSRIMASTEAKDEYSLDRDLSKKQKEAYADADVMAANIDMGLDQAKDFYSGDVHPFERAQAFFAPRSDTAQSLGKMETARSGLAVTNYSTMKGVAGASAKTEAALEASVPSATASVTEKKAWLKRKVSYDNSVIKNTILEQRRKYGDSGVSPTLIESYRKTNEMLGSLN